MTTMSTLEPQSMPMTAAGLEELQLGLEALRRRSHEELAERMREARGYGEGSNNDEYHALCEEQAVVEARIAFLEKTLRRATVVAEETAADGVAAIGATLSIEDVASGNVSRYRLAGAHERLEPGVMSAASPMGQALMGTSTGAVVTVKLPNGRSRRVRLVGVEHH
jgi:transcription elongation factor GreA